MTTEDIHKICKKYNITNYTINYDLSIDVVGDVNLNSRGLLELPLKFRNITGWFECTWNNLTSLEGAPREVGGDFYCNKNNLTSLEGSPSSVGGYFYCHSNPLESLKGIPLNLSPDNLFLPDNFTCSDYLEYCDRVKRDSKFRKILK